MTNKPQRGHTTILFKIAYICRKDGGYGNLRERKRKQFPRLILLKECFPLYFYIFFELILCIRQNILSVSQEETDWLVKNDAVNNNIIKHFELIEEKIK